MRRTYRPDPLALAVGALAAYRLTVLVTGDTITKPWRKATQEKFRDQGKEALAEALECPWCVGMWVAGPAAVATLAGQRSRLWWLAAGALASSGATGLLAAFAAPDDNDDD